MATSVVQFIGLIVFTGQTISPYIASVPSSPAFGEPPIQNPTLKSYYQVTAIVPKVSSPVDPHTPMIAFRASDNPVLTGWGTPQPIVSGWEMVTLSNAENIEFVSDATNGAVNSVDPIGLGHLGPKGVTLLPAYRAPYAGAAAVLSIRSGRLSTCKNQSGRIDTHLSLNVNQKLTVRSVSQSGTTTITKTIVLPAGADVVVANVPLSLATGNYSTNGVPHTMAYCAMTNSSSCTVGTGSSPFSCSPAFRVGHGRATPTANPFQKNEAIDFACSNTQWP